MPQKQKHRAPKLKTVQHAYHEGTSPVIPEASPLHEEDQAVEEKQSYAMVTGLLQVLVASIAYQRDLFPKWCFDIQLPSLIRTGAHRSYEQADARSNITSGDNEMARFATALAQRDQPFVTLVPGKTNGVDKLLEWLDVTFKGLLDRSLDGVRFSIYADKSRPSQPLEIYTFSFQYRNGEDGERRLMGLTAQGRGSDMITTRSVRSGMVNVIDQLKNYQQQLPALPKERYLMCHLFHSPHAPRHHGTPGFHTCADTSMAVIEDGLWYMKQRSIGSIDSGIHRMRLGIGFMARTGFAKDLENRSVLAQNIEYTRTVSRTLKPDLERRFEKQTAPPTDKQMITHPRGGFTQADEQGASIRLEPWQGGTKDSGKSTRAMRRTMSPGTLSKDSGESFRIHHTLSSDSLLPTQVMEAHDPPALPSWNWKLRPGKALEMDVKRDKNQWMAAQDDRVVRCECSCDQEELPMLQCICCQKLQHYYCYGFAQETHVHEHHCYQCLLEDTTGPLLEDMKSIAIFRRALWILYRETPSSPAEFAQKLHFDGKTTQGLIKRLGEGGYLASGSTRLSPVTTPEQLRLRSQLYHDPLTRISGFYESPEDTLPANTDSEDGEPRRKRTKTRTS